MTSRKVAGYVKARLKADALREKMRDVEDTIVAPLCRRQAIAQDIVTRRMLAMTGGELAAARRAYDELTTTPETPSEPRRGKATTNG